MAQYYQIRVGNDYIEVPDWVTLDVFQNLIDIESGSNSTLKNIEKVLRLLLEKDSDIKNINSEIKKSNKEAIERLDNSKNETKDLKKVVDDNLKNLTGMSKKTNENFTTQVKEDKKNKNDLANRQQLMFERLGSDLTKNFESMYKGDGQNIGYNITSLIKSIPITGTILGGISTFIFSVFKEYIDTITSMSDVGASFGMDLVTLKESASDVGMSLDSFSKLISENSSTLRVLGKNATDSARTFSLLSKRVSDGAEEFNFFGMTNQEINELLIQELELRRKSGQSLEYLTENQEKVANNFNELMAETSALASITGQSRREMLRSRAEVLGDSGISAFIERLDETQRDALATPATTLSGIIGEDITTNIIRSAASGFGLDYYMRGLGVGGDFGQGLRELSEFVSQNYETMDPDLLNQRLFEMVGELETTITDDLVDTLIYQKDAGNEFAAALLDTVQKVRGFEGTFEDYQAEMKAEQERIKEQEGLAIPAQLEQTSLALQESIIRQISGIVPEGGGIVDVLQKIENMSEDNKPTEILRNLFEDIENKDIFLLSEIAATLGNIFVMVEKIVDYLPKINSSREEYEESGYSFVESLLLSGTEGTIELYDKLANTLTGAIEKMGVPVENQGDIDLSGNFRQSALEDEENKTRLRDVLSNVFTSLTSINPYSRQQMDQLENQNNNGNSGNSVTGQGNNSNVDGGSRTDLLNNISMAETNRILEDLIRETRRTREAIENQ